MTRSFLVVNSILGNYMILAHKLITKCREIKVGKNFPNNGRGLGLGFSACFFFFFFFFLDKRISFYFKVHVERKTKPIQREINVARMRHRRGCT